MAFCLYWMQYSLNFLVYAARSKQYREAYVYFICRVKACIMGTMCGVATTVTTQTARIFFIDQVKAGSVMREFAATFIRWL